MFKFGTKEMAHGLKHLPHKHEVQSLYFQILHKCLVGSGDIPSLFEGRDWIARAS